MKRSDLTIGDEYAVVLAYDYGAVKLDHVASFRHRVAHCRLEAMDVEVTRGYRAVASGLRFTLLEDFKPRSRWAGQEVEVRPAGGEIVKHSGRDVLMPWPDFLKLAEEFDQQRSAEDEVLAAAEARYDRVRDALALVGVEVEPRTGGYRRKIDAVTVTLADAESLVALLEMDRVEP